MHPSRATSRRGSTVATSPHDDECPFCNIAAREDEDTREVYRDANTVAFFPLEPATLGHTLVIPRRHVTDVWGLHDDLVCCLAKTTLRVAHAIRRAMHPDGLNIIQSNGAAATQTVFHVHVHVVPRWEADAIGRIWPPETNYSEDAKDDAWELIRSELSV
jgi:histidine triad (HIT) family protein